jgi:MoaA/NifB/PqqE/SkfB family radical SAM enzyme
VSCLPREVSNKPHQGVLWVYLNGKCNFECPYCLDGRNNMPGRAASHPEFVPRLAQLRAALGFSLVFTGGEPLIEIDALTELFRTFAHVPKTVQTNGSIAKSMARLAPLCGSRDWISISIHDETYLVEDRRRALEAAIAVARAAGVRIVLQLMCSPANIRVMLARACRFRAEGYRVNMRRLFESEPAEFSQFRNAIEEASSDAWAAPAFFADRWLSVQPYRAAVVYLDGSIRMVCRDEITIGNLFQGYDLSLIDRWRDAPCRSVCHCCSCLWVHQDWGFA